MPMKNIKFLFISFLSWVKDKNIVRLIEFSLLEYSNTTYL